MNNDRIIEKIKKCLSLAKSSNPNEAATALRQAHKLMELHNLSMSDLRMSDIVEVDAKGFGSKSVKWEAQLQCAVAQCFGCEALLSSRWNRNLRKRENYCIFAGVKHKAEIAAYAFGVLLRQLKKDRSNYIKQNARYYMTRHDRSAMGDEFALGWVGSVKKIVQHFANPNTNEESALVRTYMERYNDVDPAKITERQSSRIDVWSARDAGYDQGRKAELFHAMNKREESAQLAHNQGV